MTWYGDTDCVGVWVCTFFFFQAEDGIRDLTVTGVQTCALPILKLHMIRAISSRSSSTTGSATLIFAIDIRPRMRPREEFRPCLLKPAKIRADRKSTRLNSSHSQISYAVFCLKKIISNT